MVYCLPFQRIGGGAAGWFVMKSSVRPLDQVSGLFVPCCSTREFHDLEPHIYTHLCCVKPIYARVSHRRPHWLNIQ